MRAAHLSGPDAFKAVLAQPAAAKAPHFVLHCLRGIPPSLEGKSSAAHSLAIGVLTPKRFAKRAVTRNALRRQIYAWFDAWRAHHGLNEGWFVVRLRAPFGANFPLSASSPALKRAARAELLGLGTQWAKCMPAPPKAAKPPAAPVAAVHTQVH